jgi:hypothetical protein
MLKWCKLLSCSINRLGRTSQSSRLTDLSSNNQRRRWYCVPAVPVAPLSSLLKNIDKGWIPPNKNSATKRDLKAQPIPSTRKWTINEVEFCKLHYYQVTDTSLLTHVFCNHVPLTTLANDIVEMNLPYSSIVEGVIDR